MEYMLATKVMNVLQRLYTEQKKHFNLFFKAEETLIIYLSEKEEKEIVTPSEISKKFNVTTARVAATLNSLEAKGFITREIDKEDRRKIIINLSNNGKQKANKLIEDHLAKVNSILTKLGSDNTNKFIEIVEKIIVILKEGEELC